LEKKPQKTIIDIYDRNNLKCNLLKKIQQKNIAEKIERTQIKMAFGIRCFILKFIVTKRSYYL